MPFHCARFPTWCGAALVVIVLAVVGSRAQAQDLEPRAYANIPVGLNFLIAGYGYSEGGVATDASVPLQIAEVKSSPRAGQGWFTMRRLYGALDPWFDKTWKAGEFEVVKWFDHKALRRNYEGKNRFDRFSAGVHV